MLNTEKFIEKVKLIYGDKYDYSKVVYSGMENDVIFIDKYTRKEMVVSPKKILYYKYRRITDEERTNFFIKKAKEKFGDRYDYSKVVYKGCDNEVIVIDNQTGKEKKVKPSRFLYIDKRYVRKTNNEKADIFIKKSKEKFGDRFDYSKVEYIDSKTPVTLICKEHGEFTIDMYKHLRSKDGYCDKRKEYKRVSNGILSTDYIIKRCQYIYGDKYDYSKIEYKGGNSKTELVEIICPIHGSFFKKYEHISKMDCGCPKCSKERAKEKKKLNDIISNGKKFIERSKKKFGDKFDYSEVEYINFKTPVTLICKEHGIKFNVTPSNHFNTVFGGCEKCYNEYIDSTRSKKINFKKIKPRLTEEERKERRKKHFIETATKKFGNRFDYSNIEYVDSKTPVNIIDRESNNETFSIKPCEFLSAKNGKPKRMNFTTERFIEMARKIHGDKYDYSKVEYRHNKEKVCIICPEHGEFWQTPHNHLLTRKSNCGCGCPKCSNAVSKLEEKIINVLTKENIKFKKEYVNKSIFGNMRGDFYINSYNVMIECQGSQHFEENNNLHTSYGGNLSGQIERDYKFSKCCKDANIKLLYYFEDNDVKNIDYLNNKKFKGIYTERNVFTNVDSLISCIKNG